jgi:hypothetical protein
MQLCEATKLDYDQLLIVGGSSMPMSGLRSTSRRVGRLAQP